MTKPEIQLLEKAFDAEIQAAFTTHGIHLLQTKAKLAAKLAEEGYLRAATIVWRGVTIKGYELTHAGRAIYCAFAEKV